MKKIIYGLVYDTDEATLLGSGIGARSSIDHCWWEVRVELYRTKNGRYFEVETRLLPKGCSWWNSWLLPLRKDTYNRPELTPISYEIARSLAERYGFDGFKTEPA